MNEQAGQLAKELKAINGRAFHMALSVHRDLSLRSQLAEEAGLLQKKLLKIAKELERIDPIAYKRWSHRISESILDFDFVMATSRFTSLRLGNIIKWGK